MKITGNEPINPIMDNKVLRKYIGLTIRQYYAGLAMQGNAARRVWNGNERSLAEYSVRCADLLIEELNKTEKL